MGILIFLALIVCIIALVLTLFAIGNVDTNYNMNASLKNLSVIYVIVIPAIGIIIVITWLLFR